MNKTAIKNFAIWARNKLIADIQYRAGLMGITAEGIKNALSQSTPNMEFYDIGTAQPYSITGEAIRQRQMLVETIRQKEADSDYPTAYKYILEEVAYTWFNRLIAIRFMEVNDYLPSHIRVLSSESGKVEPDLVTTPFDAELDFTPDEQETILRLKTDNALDELFQLLFIKQCNALNKILPALFEKTSDYTEVLLNLSVVDQEGVVYHLVHDIDEDDFNIEKGGQVEIIGWLYQYYNTEPKNAAFAKNGKITKDEIPAVTQLFTPDWIVRYMVQNSLGRLFIDKRKNEGVFSDGRGLDEMTLDEAEEKRIANEKYLAEQMEWKYYLPEAVQTKEVREQLDKIQQQSEYRDVRDIKVIDPCMGSGHILVYAFDVLMQLYEDAGYSQRDAAKSILENNLYGLDIDDRAYQLAYFAVMMKARQYNRRILSAETPCHVYAIQESNSINRAHLKYLGAGMDDFEVNTARVQLEGLLDTLRDAKEYGSILKVENHNWELLRRFVSAVDAGEQISMDSAGLEGTTEQLLTLIDIAEVMERKYDVVVTNPPYMAEDSMSPALDRYICSWHEDAKYDMYAAFIYRCHDILKPDGIMSMITMHNFMFSKSFVRMRQQIIRFCWVNMLHLGPRAFPEISGDVVQTCAFSVRKSNVSSRINIADVVDIRDPAGKETAFLSPIRKNYSFDFSNTKFIPGGAFGYSLSNSILDMYRRKNILEHYVISKAGVVTGADEYFTKHWSEIDYTKIEFKPQHGCLYEYTLFSRGGTFDKWYGNSQHVIRLIDLWDDSKTNKSVRRGDRDFYFLRGIGWSQMGGGVDKKYSEITDCVCKNSTPMIYVRDSNLYNYVLGYLNSGIVPVILKALNPTLSMFISDIFSLPFIIDEKIIDEITDLVEKCISISKSMYQEKEEHWQFIRSPLISQGNLRNIFDLYSEQICKNYGLLEQNENRLNLLFSQVMGFGRKCNTSIQTCCDKKDSAIRLLSYAVGCMFGRYSLDTEGLAYAGGSWDESKYKSFLPDTDAILPITDEEYLDDDIVARLCSWLEVVYGEDTLEQNLDFIAKAIGGKGYSSRDIIRNYFLKDFFKDHCKIYQKRPIYWLFDSGKQNGFKALIYLHRYTPDTIGNLRVDYLHKMQRVYESEIGRMQDMIDHSTNTREVAAATKRKEKLQKQLKECRNYDEMIAHLALSRTQLDLDDGVKVNYEKIQTASDGKKYPVLAKI